jgi:hypothetical protein
VKAEFLDTLAVVEGQQLRPGIPVVVGGAAFLGAQLWTVGEE